MNATTATASPEKAAEKTSIAAPATAPVLPTVVTLPTNGPSKDINTSSTSDASSLPGKITRDIHMASTLEASLPSSQHPVADKMSGITGTGTTSASTSSSAATRTDTSTELGAQLTEFARQHVDLVLRQAQASAQKASRRRREDEERQIQRKRRLVDTFQSFHKVYQPIFQKLWDMEFPYLGGANPFRIVIDRENCTSVGAPDYFDVIDTPMNLTYIQTKVDRMEYESVSAFFADVDLMIKNAVKCNSDPRSPFRAAAEDMKKRYMKMVKEVLHTKNVTKVLQTLPSSAVLEPARAATGGMLTGDGKATTALPVTTGVTQSRPQPAFGAAVDPSNTRPKPFVWLHPSDHMTAGRGPQPAFGTAAAPSNARPKPFVWLHPSDHIRQQQQRQLLPQPNQKLGGVEASSGSVSSGGLEASLSCPPSTGPVLEQHQEQQDLQPRTGLVLEQHQEQQGMGLREASSDHPLSLESSLVPVSEPCSPSVSNEIHNSNSNSSENQISTCANRESVTDENSGAMDITREPVTDDNDKENGETDNNSNSENQISTCANREPVSDENDKENNDDDDDRSSGGASIQQELDRVQDQERQEITLKERQEHEKSPALVEPWNDYGDLAAWGRSMAEANEALEAGEVVQALERVKVAQAAETLAAQAAEMIEAQAAEMQAPQAAETRALRIIARYDSPEMFEVAQAPEVVEGAQVSVVSFSNFKRLQLSEDAEVVEVAEAAQAAAATSNAARMSILSSSSSSDDDDPVMLTSDPIPRSLPQKAKETPRQQLLQKAKETPRQQVVMDLDDDDDDLVMLTSDPTPRQSLPPKAKETPRQLLLQKAKETPKQQDVVDLTLSSDDDDDGDERKHSGPSGYDERNLSSIDNSAADPLNTFTNETPVVLPPVIPAANAVATGMEEEEKEGGGEDQDDESERDSSTFSSTLFIGNDLEEEEYQNDENMTERGPDQGSYFSSKSVAYRKNQGRCGKCQGCTKPDCGKCQKCKHKVQFGGLGSRGACIHKPCVRFLYRHDNNYQATIMAREEDDDEEDASSKEESYSEYSNGSIAQATLSSKLGVGSRCYSKFSNGQWYWGVITELSGQGKYARYSVDYDDGDTLVDIPWTDICSEKENKEDLESPRPTKRQKTTVDQNIASMDTTSQQMPCLSLLNLHRRRCKNCVMCNKEDCGMCRACRDDNGDTSIHKQVCLLKMCEIFSPMEKAQPVDGYGRFKFYFTDPKNLPAHWRDRALHPSLEGFCVLSPRGSKQFRGVETAVKACKMPHDQRIEIAKTFYEDHIGISVRLRREHPLVGKGYFREWNDMLGRPQEIYGRIEKCEQDYFDRAWSYFTVKYDDMSRNQLLTNGTLIPANDGSITEKEAWGGCMLYDSKSSEINQIPRSLSNASAPFHTRWIIPSSRTESHVVSENPGETIRSFSMNVRGFILEIVAKKSLIPNSGLGVFVKAFKGALMSKPAQYFELQAGEMVDLCVYAPLRPQDRMDESVNLFKNFIHSWEPEGWTFDQAAHHKGKASNVFDITDDWSADLHSLARENVMVYVNETDGKPNSIPTVWAEHDPAGAVHYLIGHQEKEHGTFRLPLNGDEIELKIDYGDKYEKVRVRKGYSRRTKTEADIIKKKIEDDDSDVVRELKVYTAKEVDNCIGFLERIFTPERVVTDSDTDKVARSIIAAILLLSRVEAILKEFEGVDLDEISFCDNGYTSLEGNQTHERARKLVSRLCDLWENEHLKAVLVSKELYCIVLVPALNCASPQELASLSPLEFRTRINNICLFNYS